MKQEFQVSCPFCAVGCRFKILKGTDDVVHSSNTLDVLDFDYENDINEGAICPRGHFAYELLSHPMRLGSAYHRTNGKLKPEIPEIIFQNIAKSMKTENDKLPLAILINPMISLHDIRALLDFANNSGISTIDFVSPTDRHLFRALIDIPFDNNRCSDIRELKKLTYTLCIGDIFTKQPILSRHLLSAKYALRKNALYNINPIPSRTSWFANIFVQHQPHLEPILLFYLYQQIYQMKHKEKSPEDLAWLQEMSEDKISKKIEAYLAPEQQESLNQIAKTLCSSEKSAILYSTHYYTAASAYITGTISAAICELTGSYFIPLYTDSNFNAIEQFSKEIYKEIGIGKRPILKELYNGKFKFAFAVGWNPRTYFPGDIGDPSNIEWIISSMVQNQFPDSTYALLPQSHLYEQMDLRTNFMAWQSIGSPPVKSPIGSAQPVSHFIYQLHQKAVEQKVSFNSAAKNRTSISWKKNFSNEIDYYLNKLEGMIQSKGTWLIPTEHVTHYKDADLTRYSSWAFKNCIDETIMIPQNEALTLGLSDGQRFRIKNRKQEIDFKVKRSQLLNKNNAIVYAHYYPVRRMMAHEFAKHNSEYYLWCPKLNMEDIDIHHG